MRTLSLDRRLALANLICDLAPGPAMPDGPF
jgi:hypothetical protein